MSLYSRHTLLEAPLKQIASAPMILSCTGIPKIVHEGSLWHALFLCVLCFWSKCMGFLTLDETKFIFQIHDMQYSKYVCKWFAATPFYIKLKKLLTHLFLKKIWSAQVRMLFHYGHVSNKTYELGFFNSDATL